MPWLPHIGTCVHAGNEHIFDLVNVTLADGATAGPMTGHERFLIENKVTTCNLGPDEIDGSTDLYDRVTAIVIDWKVVGKPPCSAATWSHGLISEQNMASTRIIEQDHGTYAGLVMHRHHNGCYAGDFSGRGTVCGSVDIASRAGLAGSRVAVHGVHGSPCLGDGATVDGRGCRSTPRRRETRRGGR